MKKTLAFFTLLFGFMTSFAQSGPTFPYQAVVRNSHNQLIKDSTFAIGVEVYQGADLKYSETQSVTTNANGQFTMNIGGGTLVSGAMADVADWSVAKFKITYHLSEGDIVSENAVSPVPYALQAANNTALTDLLNTMNARMDSLGRLVDSLSNLPPTPAARSFLCGNFVVKDHEGNVYNTVKIGNQCWTKENMRCKTSPSTGENILEIPAGTMSFSGKKAYYYENSLPNIGNGFGLLYNWCAAVDTFNIDLGETSASTLYQDAPDVIFSGHRRGICPQGWHVFSEEEWRQLEEYLYGQSEYACGSQSTNIAKSLCSTEYWESDSGDCYVGNSLQDNNKTGFSLLPAGSYDRYGFNYRNEGAFLWSTTQNNHGGAYYCTFFNASATVSVISTTKNVAQSVRCLRDGGAYGTAGPNEMQSTVTSMSCEEVMDCLGDTLGRLNAMIEAQGAEIETLNGTVTAQGNTITTQGQTIETLNSTVESQGETIASQGNTIDSLSNIVDSLSNLTYGAPFTCGTDSIKDIDNNWYHTIQFGEQCWMKENLRTTKFADNTPIVNGTSSSTDVAYWYYPNNDAGNKATYGLLYNWKAVMNGASSTDNNPSGVQGICPNGWHVPSDAEWTQLTRFVKSQPAYVCAGCSGSDNDWYTYCIAKALASTTGWVSDSETCVVGDTTRSNNATGFSAMPAGFYDGDYNLFSTYTCFWSTTEDFDSYSYGRAILTYNNYVDRQFYKGSNGFSVRCVRNAEAGGGDIPSTPATMSCEEVMECMGDTLNRLNARIESQSAEIETLNGTVETLSTTVTAQEETISTQSTEIETLNTTVALQGNTIDSLSNIVDSLSNLPHSGGNTPTEVADGQPCPNAATVSDIDGNTYNTVKIGNQCWTKENLRTKLGTDGDYGYPTRADNDTVTYGRLYAWTAMMNGAQSTDYPNGSAPKDTMVRGICPTGWHVPSDAEWDTLTNYVNSVAEYRCGGADSAIANALSASTGWTDTNACCAGYSSATINKTGFAAVPAGKYYSGFDFFGNCAFFWSATEYGSSALRRRLFSVDTDVDRYHENKDAGLSVRCLRDAGIVGNAGSNESGIGSGGSHSAPDGGDNDCCSELRARLDSLENVIDSLANVINNGKVADGQPCPGVATVSDADGNTYNTVKIGSQCWMKENLRKRPTIGNSWNPGGDEGNVAANGLLYDWTAVMQVADANNTLVAVQDKHQGICPNGWHVPSQTEWETLSHYTFDNYRCADCEEFDPIWQSNHAYCVAKALCSAAWNDGGSSCNANSNAIGKNVTGFSILPAGACFSETPGSFGAHAYFWSATQRDEIAVNSWSLGSLASSFDLYSDNKSVGLSVRCIHN